MNSILILDSLLYCCEAPLWRLLQPWYPLKFRRQKKKQVIPRILQKLFSNLVATSIAPQNSFTLSNILLRQSSVREAEPCRCKQPTLHEQCSHHSLFDLHTAMGRSASQSTSPLCRRYHCFCHDEIPWDPLYQLTLQYLQCFTDKASIDDQLRLIFELQERRGPYVRATANTSSFAWIQI